MLTSFSKLHEDFEGFESEYIKILTYDLKEGYKGRYKSYAYNRVCTIIDGSKDVKINGESQFTYGKDEFVLLPPHSTVDMEMKKDTRAMVFEISDQLVSKIHNNIENRFQQSISKDDDCYVSDVTTNMIGNMRKIKDAVFSESADQHFLVDLYAQELVYNLMHEKHILSKGFDKKTNTDLAVEIIKKEGNECITIQEVASLLHMSNANLTYLFKQEFNMSPKQYQNLIRIKKSKDLLLKYNVTEVAMMVGYTNISYFIRLFKSYYGITPKQYIMQKKS